VSETPGLQGILAFFFNIKLVGVYLRQQYEPNDLIMRLGQLARKLALRPAEIVEILSGHQIQVADDPNVKLSANQLSLILQRFSPDLQREILAEDRIQEQEKSVDEPVLEVSTPDALEPPPQNTINEPLPEKSEVIKAPKIELSGLKVLGKIDIPEPKKKSAPEEQLKNENETPASVEQTRERRNSPYKEKRRIPRTTSNPIALEREREALEAKKKKEEEARLQKERRTQNYLKKVKTAAPTKAVKLVKEEVEEMSAMELKEPPKTLWGRFVRWLTT
jgi:hypothetical protein